MIKTFSGKPVAQRAAELSRLIEILKENDVTKYLEIGSRYGDTFHEIMRNLPPSSTGVAVDMVAGPWGRSDSREYLEAAVNDLIEKGYNASCVFGNSTSSATKQLITHRCHTYDCVFIDGDHQLEGLILDWINYGPLAKMVVFHDIDGRGKKDSVTKAPVDVPYVWDILKSRYKHEEIICKKNRGMGIGVLWM